ncbi:site-specific integrase [Bizionia sp.]|uniref:site-specific integrase n=1 Tax=Bizionia sp. TaxID=1954480 RepID=UPI003A8DCE1A
MKTQPIDYNKLYSEARKLFFEKNQTYNLDRKTENLAYLIALESGLRVSDLLTLKYDDINFNNDLEKYIFSTNIKKTKNSHTGIISNELYNYIQSFKEAVKLEFGANSENIFYNYKSNKLYTRQWLHKRIKLTAEKLGFKNCGVHSIRKASAINVLDRTGSLSMAQYHLTHKRATTTDNYLSVTKSSALERLAKIY